MSSASDNVKIWEHIYEAGNFMTYPTEAFVRMVLAHERAEGYCGMILDHGCGSGVNAEHLIRRGHRVHCTEVSAMALDTVAKRFRYRDLPQPSMSQFDPSRPLKGALPDFDHAVAWCSLLYNSPDRVQQDISDLIGGMKVGGCFLAAMPTPNDLLTKTTELLPDGSRRMVDGVSGQAGMLVTIPESTTQFVEWCDGLDIRDVGQYSVTIGSRHSEHMVLYGVKVE